MTAAEGANEFLVFMILESLGGFGERCGANCDGNFIFVSRTSKGKREEKSFREKTAVDGKSHFSTFSSFDNHYEAFGMFCCNCWTHL